MFVYYSREMLKDGIEKFFVELKSYTDQSTTENRTFLNLWVLGADNSIQLGVKISNSLIIRVTTRIFLSPDSSGATIVRVHV